MVIWIIGLSGSGKTTIGLEVATLLRSRQRGVVFLDGDILRAIADDDLGHTVADRERNAWRACRLCAHLDAQGLDVVCAILSIFPETRRWNRSTYSRYLEVFLDVPFADLEQRDEKKLYRRARAGELRDVVGVDIPFVPPDTPDLTLRNTFAPGSAAGLAKQILDAALDVP